MKNEKFIIFACMFRGLIAISIALLWGQPKEKILLVKLKKNPSINLQNCLNKDFWEKHQSIQIPDFNWTTSFDDNEITPRENCTYPQLLLITAEKTYVISLFCQAVFCFENKAPYTPSYTSIPCDIDFDTDFRYFIEGLVQKTLKIQPNKLYEEYALHYTPPVLASVDYQSLDLILNKTQIDVEASPEDMEDPEVPDETVTEEPSNDIEDETSDD